MRIRVIYFAIFFCVFGLAAISIGCGAAKECSISPIDIEERAADSRDLDKDLADVLARLADVESELASWQKRYTDKKGQPAALKEKLRKLKQASGRTEKPEEEEGGKLSIEELLGEQ
jgi:Skp family chaperone for outer membrane proteins